MYLYYYNAFVQLAQVSGGHAVTAEPPRPQPPPMSLLQVEFHLFHYLV